MRLGSVCMLENMLYYEGRSFAINLLLYQLRGELISGSVADRTRALLLAYRSSDGDDVKVDMRDDALPDFNLIFFLFIIL